MLYISKQRSPPSSVAASAALARPRRSPRSRSKLTRSSQSTPMRPYVCTPMSLSSLGLAALGCAAHLGQHVEDGSAVLTGEPHRPRGREELVGDRRRQQRHLRLPAQLQDRKSGGEGKRGD